MTHPVRFGSAEIRPAERQLLIDGRPILIGARAFDVLNMLITHRERVVGKEELLETVWPGLVVEENNLQVQISTLRKILGTSAISTITGLGYQFTAALDTDLSSGRQVPGTALPPTPGTHSIADSSVSPDRAAPVLSRRPRYRTPLIIALSLLAIVGLILWMYLRARPEVPAVAPSGALKAPPHSVAVLPFANMSGDPAQDYFSDGLSEELLDSLSSIPDLHVAARISSFTFKDKGAMIADIGRELNVGAVLEGSVRKDGQHVRINAQLVDVATGYDLWSHSYDRDITNILALQTEIAAAVSKALQATLLPNAAAVIELGVTQNAQAFEAYLQGEILEGRIDKEAVLTRIAAYEEAIRQDPNFAKAYGSGKVAALDLFGGSYRQRAPRCTSITTVRAPRRRRHWHWPRNWGERIRYWPRFCCLAILTLRNRSLKPIALWRYRPETRLYCGDLYAPSHWSVARSRQSSMHSVQWLWILSTACHTWRLVLHVTMLGSTTKRL